MSAGGGGGIGSEGGGGGVEGLSIGSAGGDGKLPPRWPFVTTPLIAAFRRGSRASDANPVVQTDASNQSDDSESSSLLKNMPAGKL
jgi:hypothetical protein